MSVPKRLAEAAQRHQTELQSQLTNAPALGEVSILAERQMMLEDTKDRLEAELKDINRQLEEVATKLLPNAMQAVGLEEIKLTDGSKVSVSQFYSASIKEENRNTAHEWLRENGHGSLIKNSFEINLGKGEDAKASKLRKELVKQQVPFSEDSSVHSSTLRAWLKEQIEGGVKVPLELFGAFIGRKAKIKRP
jgi:hypothetical protein